MSKISPKQDFNKNRAYFFIFVTWISLIFFEIFGGIHVYFGNKSWTQGGIHEVQKKNWNHLGIRLGPRTVAPTFAPRLTTVRGPSRMPKWFQIILFLHFMKPPWFQDLLPKYPWNHQKFQKKSMKPGHKKKKMRSFFLKPSFSH